MTINFHSIKCCVIGALRLQLHSMKKQFMCIIIILLHTNIVFPNIIEQVLLNIVIKQLYFPSFCIREIAWKRNSVATWERDVMTQSLHYWIFFPHTSTNHICVAPCYVIITKYKCHDPLCIFSIIMGWMEFAFPNYLACRFHPCSAILCLDHKLYFWNCHKWWDIGCKCT